MQLLAVCAIAACGGAAPPPPREETLDNHAAAAVVEPATTIDRLTLERTACLGTCPVYTVTLSRDGVVEWNGEANVAVTGRATAHVDRHGLEQIAVALDAIHFFERDRAGKLPAPPCAPGTICVGTISTCSDTSHTNVTVTRGAVAHTVSDLHCDQDPDLARLEALIGDIANTAPWIGR